jgi:zinc protease
MDLPKLDLQRDVVKNERRQNYDNVPYGRAYETILAALYPKSHPYSWPTIGSMADLSAASLNDVKDFFRTYYAPNNATIAIAGDFDRDSVKTWINRYFAQIPRGPAEPLQRTPPVVVLTRDTSVVLEDRVQLPRLYYAWHTVKSFAPDDAALDVAAFILAGDRSSRLYRRLVYDLQVAQRVSAFQNGGRLDGFFQVDATPKEGRTPAEIAKLIDAEVTALVKAGPTQREVQRAQNTLRANFLDQLASVLGKADQLNYYNYYLGSPDYAQQDAARYDKVTAADVQRVVAQYLGAKKVILTVVPAGKTDLQVQGGTR